MIASVEEFILYDDVQFTKNDWRNRNKIKTPQGLHWLTIPVGNDIRRTVRQVEPIEGWQLRHWKTLAANYARAPFFDEVAEWLRPMYDRETSDNLSQINRRFLEQICKALKIETKISNVWDYEAAEGRTERLVDLCARVDADVYVSGPAAKAYLDEALFRAAGINVEWFDYSGYPQYPQLWGGFEHGVSILDLLFNCGEKKSCLYMKYVKP